MHCIKMIWNTFNIVLFIFNKKSTEESKKGRKEGSDWERKKGRRIKGKLKTVME